MSWKISEGESSRIKYNNCVHNVFIKSSQEYIMRMEREKISLWQKAERQSFRQQHQKPIYGHVVLLIVNKEQRKAYFMFR